MHAIHTCCNAAMCFALLTHFSSDTCGECREAWAPGCTPVLQLQHSTGERERERKREKGEREREGGREEGERENRRRVLKKWALWRDRKTERHREARYIEHNMKREREVCVIVCVCVNGGGMQVVFMFVYGYVGVRCMYVCVYVGVYVCMCV